MQDARYFRDQAALTLEVARQARDPRVAEKLRSDPARFFARAVEVERQAQAAVQPHAVTEGNSR
jgi:hypothetical protein